MFAIACENYMDNFILSFVVYTFPHRSTTCCRGIEKQMPRASSGRVSSIWRRNDGERQRFALARTTLRSTNVVYTRAIYKGRYEAWRVGELESWRDAVRGVCSVDASGTYATRLREILNAGVSSFLEPLSAI